MRKELVVLVTLCAEQGLEDRVLFGSDFPLVDPARYTKTVRRLRILRLTRRIGESGTTSPIFKRKLLGRIQRAFSVCRAVRHTTTPLYYSPVCHCALRQPLRQPSQV
jgi:hypothetical protein